MIVDIRVVNMFRIVTPLLWIASLVAAAANALWPRVGLPRATTTGLERESRPSTWPSSRRSCRNWPAANATNRKNCTSGLRVASRLDWMDEYDRLYALASDDGRFLWGGRKGYRKRPIIVGQQVFAEPFAWDLKTGKQRTIENPLSGLPQTLDFHRGYIGCSHLLASGAALFGNKPGIAYWNIDSAAGFVPFESLVFGCGICATPACGVFLAPEGRSGCTCPAGIHTSLALYPKENSRAWGIGFTGGIAPTVSLPVRHAAINLAHPGWREDQQHRLWLPYPARRERRPWAVAAAIPA